MTTILAISRTAFAIVVLSVLLAAFGRLLRRLEISGFMRGDGLPETRLGSPSKADGP